MTICLSGFANRGAMVTPPVCLRVSQGLNIISSTHPYNSDCSVIISAILLMFTTCGPTNSLKKHLLHYRACGQNVSNLSGSVKCA